MSFLGLSLLDWTAIGTLALAAATIAIVIVTVRIAKADRERDDAKREQDRQWDSDRRKEDRDRDEQLRGEDRQESERRFRAEQRDRQDYEARQVTVEAAQELPATPGPPSYSDSRFCCPQCGPPGSSGRHRRSRTPAEPRLIPD